MAETTADTYKGNRVVKYHFTKADGEEVIEYYNNIQLPKTNDTVSIVGSISNITTAADKSALKATITYNSTLNGAYNNYTLAIAKSEASQSIDYMWINMDAWYAAGSYLGSDSVSNPSGTKVLILSADVSVPSNPFNYQIGSAESQHEYKNAGYADVSRPLSWSR